MGLSINPIAVVIGAAAAGIAAQKAAAEKAPAIANVADKAALDKLVADKSGAIGTSLNGLTPNNGIIDAASSAMGDAASDAVSSITGGGNLPGGADSLGGVLQGAAAGVANVGADISGALNKLGGGDLAGGVQQFATGISKGAGVLNNLLSLKRAENLPAEGELFSQGQGVELSTTNKEDWRVRINCDWTIFKGNKMFEPFVEGGVVFPTIPSISFNSKANYSSIDPTHNNYPFQAYKNSQIDEINIAGEFIAETSKDAAYWLGATQFFKTATKMFFGQGENVGAPPIICTLNGFGSSNFNDIPVVIKSFNIEYPDDVNYIRCDAFGDPSWVPIVSQLTINVQPVYNRRNLRQFSLTDYAAGTLKTPTGQGYL